MQNVRWRAEVLVQVGGVRRSGGGLDVLGREPVVFDVVAEGDGAEGVVVPAAGQDTLLLVVSGSILETSEN